MDKKTNNLSTCQLQTRQQNKTNNLSTRQLKSCQLKKDTSGGYCGGVPPLPIPNREVKPTCADGTAMQCGRVGSRLLFIRAFIWAIKWTLFLFMSLMGLLQISQQKVWCSRTWRKSFLESWMVMYLVMEEGVVILVEFYGKEMFLNLSH